VHCRLWWLVTQTFPKDLFVNKFSNQAFLKWRHRITGTVACIVCCSLGLPAPRPLCINFSACITRMWQWGADRGNAEHNSQCYFDLAKTKPEITKFFSVCKPLFQFKEFNIRNTRIRVLEIWGLPTFFLTLWYAHYSILYNNLNCNEISHMDIYYASILPSYVLIIVKK